MSLPAAYCPLEFSAHRRPTHGLQRLRSVIKRLHLNVFLLDSSSSAVRFSYIFLGFTFDGVLYLRDYSSDKEFQVLMAYCCLLFLELYLAKYC